VPELPEVELVRRELEPVMKDARIERVTLRRPDLRTSFPDRFAERLEGRALVAVERRAKYLLAPLSSGETLVMHLGMSGSFEVLSRSPRAARAEPNRHDHVVFDLSTGASVVFNDPRRFGFMDLVATDALPAHPTIGTLGPEPLSAEFDAAALARACAGKRTTLKAALLDQRVVAGLGNIYASEALHVAGLSPQRQASTIATRNGVPREAAYRLAVAIKMVLEYAIDRAEDARFRVYDREGARCRRRGCRGVVRRRTQGGRSTFYCRECQR
jgi:formamidopyrimidine-DNA glycosylase